MKYNELKAWFKGRKLPDKMSNEYMIIQDVKKAVDTCVAAIEADMIKQKTEKGEVENTPFIVAEFRRLKQLKQMVEKPECHNGDLLKFNGFTYVRED